MTDQEDRETLKAAAEGGGKFEPGTRWDMVPERMRESIRAYVEERRPIGGFLTALLSNNLMNATLRADDENRAALADWVGFLYEYAPANCWGSPEIVAAWLAKGREDGAN